MLLAKRVDIIEALHYVPKSRCHIEHATHTARILRGLGDLLWGRHLEKRAWFELLERHWSRISIRLQQQLPALPEYGYIQRNRERERETGARDRIFVRARL